MQPLCLVSFAFIKPYTMKSKTKQKLRWAPTLLIALIIGMGAVMKLAAMPQLVELYSKIGLAQYLQILGMTELLFVALFLWPRSMKIGFLLLTGYFGGAMAVEMSNGTPFIFPGSILVLVWIAAYLRDNSLFRNTQTKKILLQQI